MDPRELVLDGNAAAGVLREIFTVEMTVARDTCFACGDVRAPGEVVVCARGPGIVARCSACESILFRVSGPTAAPGSSFVASAPSSSG